MIPALHKTSACSAIFFITAVSAVIVLTSCSVRQLHGDDMTPPSVTVTAPGSCSSACTTTVQESTEQPSAASSSCTETDPAASRKLFDYLADEENGIASGNAAVRLHNGDWNNACVYAVSEALRRIGEDVPEHVCRTEELSSLLESLGYSINYDLESLEPGDICFTTDESGVIGGRPTHTYIFLSWESKGAANIYDNQIYDYGSLYHIREIAFSYLNGDRSKPKEATAFFMRK